MSLRGNSISGLLLLLLLVCMSAFVEELDDSFLETRGADDIWLIKFYAPWCSFCKQLDPVWHQIGSELRSVGSPVNVGKSDATVSIGLAKEFKVRGYPAILMLKKDVKYNYSGPRTREGILDFANRVGGPLVRSLSSLQLFQHAMDRHDVMFVYVGATSPLKVVSLPSLPAVVVFKDGAYFTFNVERDGDLKSWINRERFQNYMKIDSYTLYAMGETGKLVLLALVEANSLCKESLRYKSLVEKVSSENRETYSRHFHFGYMEGGDYIKGLVMGEVTLPSLIVVNLSNDGYFLPPGAMETERHLLDFLDGVLESSIECQGGNSVHQRIRRIIYDIQVTLTPLISQAPLFGCFLVGFPLAIAIFFCYLCRKARSNMSEDDDEGDALSAPSPQSRKKLSDKKSD
ncbi:protein disulfide-isomerase TMX3-like isoform X2 [Sparus aurata]|uniref:protein disulfide-isomerase TMX3-like isoform X2 n=1 Tax=Sparus aurata TaxID=8175 RepID=UPI0011C1843E|nr:protein disulfide-isomerase TMX3-like isoform X2 [Sparus aurata]